ncbi:MAG TPA: TorF family putative porin, partial [Phycisphaeraceae bacterium]
MPSARSVCAEYGPKLLVGAIMMTYAAGAALAQSDEAAAPAAAAGPNTGKIHLEMGASVVTEYWFRGIGQENEGLILQPYATVGVDLLENDDFTLGGFVGTWNSIHDSTPGDAWFESDFTVGLSAGLSDNLTLDVAYVNLYNPAGGDSFAEEVDLVLSYDDTELAQKFSIPLGDGEDPPTLGLPFPLQPHVAMAFEIDGGSDAGENKGIYLELGIEPQFSLVESESYPVTLSTPMTVGLSLDDYYENAQGEDDTFGYFDAGLVLSMPLDFVPADYGQWEASLGVHAIFLGDTAQ